MTDINLTPPSYPGWKGAIADLARPFAIYVTTIGVNASAVTIAWKTDKPELIAAAAFMTALFTGLGALYGFKALEVSAIAKQAAGVHVAQAQTPTGQ